MCIRVWVQRPPSVLCLVDLVVTQCSQALCAPPPFPFCHLHHCSLRRKAALPWGLQHSGSGDLQDRGCSGVAPPPTSVPSTPQSTSVFPGYCTFPGRNPTQVMPTPSSFFL